MGGAQPTPKEKAQSGVRMIEEAILDLLRQKGDWTAHSEIQRALGISFTNLKGEQRGYFSGLLLDKLESEGRVIKQGGGRGNPLHYKLAV